MIPLLPIIVIRQRNFPKTLLAKMLEARKAGLGRHYRYQVSLATIDLTLHSLNGSSENTDPKALSNKVFEDVYLAVPAETAFVASFGHLTDYDAGYYGYLWSKAIAQDMASIFSASPKKFLDEEIGLRLRREIYEVGDSRDVNTSIEKFLGRPRSLKPFFQELGIQK